MAFKNKIICNKKTGQDIRFLQTAKDTNNLLLEIESTYNRRNNEPPAHYHPRQEEDFLVLAGELTVKMDGQTNIYKQGDSFHIPKYKVHAMWNNSDHKTIVNWKVMPAMNTENLFETLAGLANEDKTNADGRPGILQLALTANKYSAVFRLSKPPFAIQKLLFSLLSPVAYTFGYRPSYKKYID